MMWQLFVAGGAIQQFGHYHRLLMDLGSDAIVLQRSRNLRLLLGQLLGNLLTVAVDTETHIHVHRPFHELHLLHIAVAALARHAGRDVRSMAEVDKIGLFVDIRPLHATVFVKGLDDLRNA